MNLHPKTNRQKNKKKPITKKILIQNPLKRNIQQQRNLQIKNNKKHQ